MGNYTINGVKNCSTTKGSMRLLLIMIADAIPDDALFRKLTTPALGTYCNCTERFTRELLTKLLATGELIAIQAPGRKTQYAIPILEGEPGYDPQPCEDETHTCTKFHTPLTVTRDELYRAMYVTTRASDRAKGRNHSSGVEGGTIVPGTPEPQFRGGGNHSSGEGGTIVPSYPSDTHIDQPKDRPKSRTRDDVILELRKQKTETPERPRSMPTAGNTALALDTAPDPDPTPPVAPPPPPQTLGTERTAYWLDVRRKVESRFGGGFIHNYVDRCKLYERAPGDYVLLCPTAFVQEQIMTRARNELVLQLAAVVRSHVELEVVVA